MFVEAAGCNDRVFGIFERLDIEKQVGCFNLPTCRCDMPTIWKQVAVFGWAGETKFRVLAKLVGGFFLSLD